MIRYTTESIYVLDDGEIILRGDGPHGPEETAANAQRAAACLEACDGYDNPADMREELDRLNKILEQMIHAVRYPGGIDGSITARQLHEFIIRRMKDEYEAGHAEGIRTGRWKERNGE